jgi:hypothetical protein
MTSKRWVEYRFAKDTGLNKAEKTNMYYGYNYCEAAVLRFEYD